MPWSKRPRQYTYRAVSLAGKGAYGSEVITLEAALIAVGAFMLAGIMAEHNDAYRSITDFDGALNWMMAVLIYLGCLGAVSGLVAIRFYGWYRGLPILLAVVAIMLAVLGLMEYDDAVMSLS